MSSVMKNKSPEIKCFLDYAAKQMGWSGSDKNCRTCNKPITEFRDDLSRKEYQISGMCQECQDSVFGR